MTIRVKNWSANFEKADNRRLKVFSWVAVPTEMAGKKFRRLSKMKDGIEIFGVFILMLELAGKMPEKGVFKDSDGDLSYDDLELMTGFPSKSFKKAIPVLCSDRIGWLADSTRVVLGQDSGNTQPTVHNTTVQDNTKQNIIGNKYFEEFWKVYPLRKGKKVGRKKSLDIFLKLNSQDYGKIIRNANNYGINNDFPKDPERFLKDDFWKDWDSPQNAERPKTNLERDDENLGNYLTELNEGVKNAKHIMGLREIKPVQSGDNENVPRIQQASQQTDS